MRSQRAIAAAVAIVLVIAGTTAALILLDRPDTADKTVDRTPQRLDGGPRPRTAPSVTDTPTPPANLDDASVRATSGEPAQDEDGNSTSNPDEITALRQFIEATTAVLRSEGPSLAEARAAVLAALQSGDELALRTLLAPDEGDQSVYLGELVDRYPQIVAAVPVQVVNVFTHGQATLYFTYAVVQWTDAGITSEHTLLIPLRFVDGNWYLTSIDDSISNIVFVHAVQL